MEKCGKGGQHAVALSATARAGRDLFRKAGGRTGMSALRACSACAGDYEDPDRAVGPTSEEVDDSREDAEDANVDEFPAEQE